MRKAIPVAFVTAAILAAGCAKKSLEIAPAATFDGRQWHCAPGWTVYGVEERAVNGQEPVAVCVR
jgi:hypothetical protein